MVRWLPFPVKSEKDTTENIYSKLIKRFEMFQKTPNKLPSEVDKQCHKNQNAKNGNNKQHNENYCNVKQRLLSEKCVLPKKTHTFIGKVSNLFYS